MFNTYIKGLTTVKQRYIFAYFSVPSQIDAVIEYSFNGNNSAPLNICNDFDCVLTLMLNL